ncbi:amidohydrolase [Micromonospora sp. D93]|uniref:amidohydrolase n=1 Tax=Micromonospora sp. D93 TaxID=2824886 RepID=UPI001B3614A2|nr:amidohydrolase [Micromonospora sp. D93]MBQ1017624.1 amidohydrolase [Micromonospora sp. D93]
MTTPGPDRSALLGEFYRDLHRHPELATHEHRTAARIVAQLADPAVEVTVGVGGTGVVAVLRNGPGPVVMLRADMDGLPVAEATGLDYASTAYGRDPQGNDVPIMHACGHDMHVACLVGAVWELSASRASWAGTVVAVFQPAEEIAAGARLMVDDGLFERFPRPDVILGQHVAPLPPGVVGYVPGIAMANADLLVVRLFGRGGHGSRPESTVDPIVMAAAVVMRLQGVVARELLPSEPAVLTVGYIHSGVKATVIPDMAELGLSLRTFSEESRDRALAAIRRIVSAEAAASGADREAEVELTHRVPALLNDEAVVSRTVERFADALGRDRVIAMEPVTASDDFGTLGRVSGAPAFYWFFGGPATRGGPAVGIDQAAPSNHAPDFAPVIESTLGTGVTCLVTAAREWLGTPAEPDLPDVAALAGRYA